MTHRRFYRAEQTLVAIAFAVWGLAVATSRLAHAVCPCGQHRP